MTQGKIDDSNSTAPVQDNIQDLVSTWNIQNNIFHVIEDTFETLFKKVYKKYEKDLYTKKTIYMKNCGENGRTTKRTEANHH